MIYIAPISWKESGCAKGATYCAERVSVWVCVGLSVRPLAYLKMHVSKLHELFWTFTRDCSSLILWCNTICTSGLVDDVTFSRNGPNKYWGLRRSELFIVIRQVALHSGRSLLWPFALFPTTFSPTSADNRHSSNFPTQEHCCADPL